MLGHGSIAPFFDLCEWWMKLMKMNYRKTKQIAWGWYFANTKNLYWSQK